MVMVHVTCCKQWLVTNTSIIKEIFLHVDIGTFDKYSCDQLGVNKYIHLSIFSSIVEVTDICISYYTYNICQCFKIKEIRDVLFFTRYQCNILNVQPLLEFLLSCFADL